MHSYSTIKFLSVYKDAKSSQNKKGQRAQKGKGGHRVVVVLAHGAAGPEYTPCMISHKVD